MPLSFLYHWSCRSDLPRVCYGTRPRPSYGLYLELISLSMMPLKLLRRDRYWLLHTSQKVSVKAPLFTMVHTFLCRWHRNHYFHQYHRNATPENKKLFCYSRNHCKKVLKEVQLCRNNSSLCCLSAYGISWHLEDLQQRSWQAEVYHTSSF